MNHLKTILGCEYDVVLIGDGLGEPSQDHLGV